MESERESRIEAALRVRCFEELPTPQEFSDKIEPTNVPAIFRGAVKDWKAIANWNPLDGGLDYLQERVGSATIEAMVSKSGSIFNGDIRNHERVPIPFSTFIISCRDYLQTLDVSGCSSVVQEEARSEAGLEDTCSFASSSLSQFYAAQVPIYSLERKESCPLEILSEDIQQPALLGSRTLASINYWMNRANSRSSTHYDPHHNLLCVVSGRKQVDLWPPSACPILYPLPVYGEASNHSAVDVEQPDISVHPRAEFYKEYSQHVILFSGDALFIPEGWFHQVDSDNLTIAVNFWWKSEMMSKMSEHMDAYYLRRILNRLVEKELDRIKFYIGDPLVDPVMETLTNSLLKSHKLLDFRHQVFLPVCLKKIRSRPELNSEGNDEKNGGLQQLEPHALNVLYELVSLVHDTVNLDVQQQAGDSNKVKDSLNPNSGLKQNDKNVSPSLENDTVANILLAVEPRVLRNVLLSMVHHFPRTLEALIVHLLSPVGAEVLTRKFDDMDQQVTNEEQEEFYRLFYSVFDDQYAAMDAILNGKELFAFQVFKKVMEQYLGVHVDKIK